MKKCIAYSFLSLIFWLSSSLHANQLAINQIDSFRILGISLKDTIAQVDTSIASQKSKIRCKQTDTAETKRRNTVVPSSNYRDCLYQDPSDPMKWYKLTISARNGNIKKIEFSGTITSSEDIQIMEEIRGVYKTLSVLDLEQKLLSFSEKEIVGASSPVSVQKLLVKQKEECKGFPITVSLETDIMTDLPNMTLRSIKIKLERDSSNSCDRAYRVPKNSK